MKEERNEQAKRIGWARLVVDVAFYSHFASFIANMLVFHKARSLRSLTLLQASQYLLLLFVAITLTLLLFSRMFFNEKKTSFCPLKELLAVSESKKMLLLLKALRESIRSSTALNCGICCFTLSKIARK
jgi:hypothetical protein